MCLDTTVCEAAVMPADTPISTTDAIRRLNDEFRKTFVGGAVLITPGIAALPLQERSEVLAAVRDYDMFEYENDPHGEHDLGILDLGTGRYLWKIDYYDRDLSWASPDPANPSVTSRVLTVMTAAEY